MSQTKISSREKTGRGPQRHEQYFGAMFDQAAVGVARVSTDGRFLVVNGALCRMLGYTKHELLSKSCEEITHPDDRASEATRVKRLFAGEETSYTTIKRCLHRTGSLLWVTETSSIVEDHDGLLCRVCLIQINERKLAEERFRAAIEAATNSMVMVDQRGKIVLVNSNTEELFGYSRAELLGNSIEVLLVSLFEKSRHDLFSELMGQLQHRPMGTKWDAYGRRRDGELFPARLGLTPVQTLRGTWILTSIVDMSEHTWPAENLRESTVTIPVVRIDSISRDTIDNRSASITPPQAG